MYCSETSPYPWRASRDLRIDDRKKTSPFDPELGSKGLVSRAPQVGLEPTTLRLRTTSAFAARSPGSWSGLSLDLHPWWSGPRRRVSTPSEGLPRLGSGLGSHTVPRI